MGKAGLCFVQVETCGPYEWMDAHLRVFKPLKVDEKLTLKYQALDFAFHFI